MFMRFLGGGVKHIATQEAVDRFEQQVCKMLGLIEDTVRDVGVLDIDMGDDVALSDLDDDEVEEGWEDSSSDVDSESESDNDELEYLDKLDEQYVEEEMYGYPES